MASADQCELLLNSLDLDAKYNKILVESIDCSCSTIAAAVKALPAILKDNFPQPVLYDMVKIAIIKYFRFSFANHRNSHFSILFFDIDLYIY